MRAGDRWRYHVACDMRSPWRIILYQWRARGTDLDRYLDTDEEFPDSARRYVAHAAHLNRRMLTGPLQYAYVADLGELDRDTRRTVRRMRWHAEPRPWRWRSCVLIQAWQPTSRR
jgi:hypothetical protein